MNIENTIIESVLKPYTNKYLLDAKEEFPLFEGKFLIKQSAYLNLGVSSGHLNAIDALICYNQLAYVSIANAIKYKKIPKFSNISFEYFEKSMLQGVMYKLDTVVFRKPINTASDFYGRIVISDIKRFKNTYFLNTSYDFENGKATANVNIAMQLQ